MPSEGTALVSFRVGELAPAMDARRTTESLGLIAQRDLERYYYLLQRSIPTFSQPEASLIVDACNGWHIEPYSVPLLWAQVADSLDDGLAAKWGIDGAEIVTRLRALSYAEALATCDAVERFWNNAEGLGTDAALRVAGLVR